MKILFIGNRYKIYDYLLNNFDYQIRTFALEDSYLFNYCKVNSVQHTLFNLSDKHKILNEIINGNFDVLISNGCPFKLPIINKIELNIHPTYLPYLKGKTPINGVFYNEMDFFGATMHYISDEIDGGNIIYQEKHKLTEDVDLGLLYFLSFQMELTVFSKGWKILNESNFDFVGVKQDSLKSTFFNRTYENSSVDFKTDLTNDILKKIKSFGIKGQGVTVNGLVNNKLLKIYEADKIFNPILVDLFQKESSGEVLLSYNDNILVKTHDGIIRLKRYE